MTKQKLSIFVKISIFTFLIFLFAIESQAQSISIFDIDTTNFPIMKAKLRVYDDKGNPIFPNISDLKLQEDGIERKITNITCPTAPDPYSLSACIMVDTYKYIDLARSGTQELIKFMNMPKDEIGITYMDHSTLIFQDFTKNRANALIKAGQIPSAPGVDINSMFYTPLTGGIPFIKDRKSTKKILVLVSDLHCPNLNIDEKKLLEDAKKYDISIYSILLGTNDYSGLFKRIANNTGAKVFENVKDLSQITNIFQIIKNQQQFNPCTITWESEVTCLNGTINIDLTYNLNSYSTSYETSKKAIAELMVNPSIIRFGKKNPLNGYDTTIIISAKNSDFTIKKINLKFGSSDFTIKNITFPLFIPKNTNKEITIQFTPIDSSLKYASFEIESDLCFAYFSANGGFPKIKTKNSTIKLTHPNGGETFVVGSDTNISWTGVSPKDTVTLKYSIDNGNKWNLITDLSTNLKYNWKKIPKPSSTQCLIQIKQDGTYSDTNSVFTLSWHSDAVLDIAYSPDGSRVATASYDNTAKIWDANTGALIQTLLGHTGYVVGIEYSPDGSRVATVSFDSTTKIWDANTGALIQTLSGHTGYVMGIAYSPDGSRVATASYDNTAKIWDANTGALIQTLSGHTSAVMGIAYSPDGSRVATASYDNSAKIWDANTGALIQTLSGHTYAVNDIAFSPDGTRIATASSDIKAKIWDAKTGTLIQTLSGHTDGVHGITYSPDGKRIATSSYDKTAKIWDANTGALIQTLSGNTSYVYGISFSPDGSRLVTSSYDKTAKIWDANTGALIQTLSGHTSNVYGISFSPNGSRLATASNDKTAKIWDANTGALIQTLSGHTDAVISIEYSPDGSRIATVSNDKTAKIWDANTGALIQTLLGYSNWVNGLAFSPDGSRLTITSNDNTAKIWDANTGALIQTLSGHTSDVLGIAYSPDGNRLATASWDKTAKIWDAYSGALIQTLSGHTSFVIGIAYSPDGSRVATASFDSTAKIWDANTGTLIQTLSGHTDGVDVITYSPDGKRIATASYDKTAKIWDVNTGALIRTLSGHTNIVLDIAYSPNGNRLATSSYDKTVKIWEIDTPPLQEDQSDSVFSIISPDPEFKKINIDMGKLVLGASKDTMVTAVLCNNGPAPLHVLGVDVTSGDTNDFMVPRGAGDFYLDSGGCRDFMFEFMPTKLGLRQAKITVRSTIGDFVDTINIVGEGIDPKVSISNAMIDFGKVYVGEQKDTLQVVTIKNTGTGDIEITNSKYLGPNVIDFSTISGSGKFTLKTGETRKMDLRFKPSEKGRTSGRLAFEFNGPGSPAIIQLIGEGVNKGPIIQSQDKFLTDLACANEKLDTLLIENKGNQKLDISSAKFIGTNPNEFEMVKPFSPFSIDPNSVNNFEFKFKPNSNGEKVADLQVISNSVEEDTLYIQVRASFFNSTYSIDKSTIDIGTICPNQTIDTNFVITNNSNSENHFELVYSPNLEQQNLKFNISANQQKSEKIRFQGQANEGLINEKIQIIDSICNNVKIIEIIGKVENSKIDVQAGTIIGKVGNIASTDLILENTKSHKITITDTSAIAPFYFDNLTLPIILDSAEKKVIKVNYLVKDKTKYSISASFISGDCNDSSKALITNKSVNSSAKLQINTVSAYPGDEIDIPIMLKNAEDLDVSNSKFFNVYLTFNATLLEPIGNTPIGSLSNDKKLRTIQLKFSKKDYPNNVIETLKFKVGLGNDSTTSLLFTDPRSDSNDVNLVVESGEFHLLGICRAAGPRLINPNGEVKLSLIRPNPVGDNGELDIETIENGLTELYIVNLKGEKVATLYQGELAAGKQTLIISTKDLSNGTYFVILQTPTVTQKVKMEVVK